MKGKFIYQQRIEFHYETEIDGDLFQMILHNTKTSRSYECRVKGEKAPIICKLIDKYLDCQNFEGRYWISKPRVKFACMLFLEEEGNSIEIYFDTPVSIDYLNIFFVVYEKLEFHPRGPME